MKKLVLFDVCKTLVNTNSTKEYICFLDSNNIWNKIYSRILKNRYLSILLYLINKYLNIDLSRELVFSFFKWISISNEDKLSKKFFNQYILKKTKIMDILIKYKKNKSYDIYLVSASINQPIDLLANHLWVWSFSTRLIVENNKYTWHVYHDLLWDKEYALILEEKTSEETYVIDIDSWENNVPYSLGEENNNSYEDSWFKGEIDFKDIPNGDYNLYMIAYNEDNFTIQSINNFFNKNISRRGEDNNHGYNFKVQQRSKTKMIELSIRDELYTTSEAPTTRNMVNGYDEISFKNNKLYMYAYSYDFDGIYNSKLNITRKVILENTETYKQEVFDVGCTEGPFELETLDKKDKKYAWYEQELDLSNLTPGKYSIQVYTKTSNATNYDELTDISKRLNKQATINNKKYTISVNRERNNRIELTIE